jgi:predicted DNA-binding antitoxin AbrB/MazE fold protein
MMEAKMTVIEAIYENGVFRPIEPVGLEEKQRVSLCVEPLRQDQIEALAWIEKVSRFREQMAAEHGLLPDSTIDIAEDRMR